MLYANANLAAGNRTFHCYELKVQVKFMFRNFRERRAAKKDPRSHGLLYLPEDEDYSYERPDPIGIRANDYSDTPKDDVSQLHYQPLNTDPIPAKFDGNPSHPERYLYYYNHHWTELVVQMTKPSLFLLLNIGILIGLITLQADPILLLVPVVLLILNTYLFFRARFKFYHTFISAQEERLTIIYEGSDLFFLSDHSDPYAFMNLEGASYHRMPILRKLFREMSTVRLKHMEAGEEDTVLRRVKHGEYLSDIVRIRPRY